MRGAPAGRTSRPCRATHPDSRFRKFLVLQRLLADARRVPLNRDVIQRSADGSERNHEITVTTGPARVFGDVFGVSVAAADAAAILARLPVGSLPPSRNRSVTSLRHTPAS